MNCRASTNTGWPISKPLEDDGQSSAPSRSLFPSLWDNEPSAGGKADAAGKCLRLKTKKDDTTILGTWVPHQLNIYHSTGLSLVCGQFKVTPVGIG